MGSQKKIIKFGAAEKIDNKVQYYKFRKTQISPSFCSKMALIVKIINCLQQNFARMKKPVMNYLGAIKLPNKSMLLVLCFYCFYYY